MRDEHLTITDVLDRRADEASGGPQEWLRVAVASIGEAVIAAETPKRRKS